MSDVTPEWQKVLLTWDVKAEQRKADFLEYLYDLYKPEDHTYTGLYQDFCELAPEVLKNLLLDGFAEITDASGSDSDPQQPVCDV